MKPYFVVLYIRIEHVQNNISAYFMHNIYTLGKEATCTFTVRRLGNISYN